MTLHNLAILSAASLVLLTSGCAGPGHATRAEPGESLIASKIADLPTKDIVAAGDLAMRQGDPERARFIYSQALAAEKSADTWFRLGRANVSLNRQADAWRAFSAALSLAPDHVGAYEELGLLYMSTRQKELARTTLTKTIQLDPGRWRAQNALGVLADAEGDYRAAIGYYGAALEQRPDSAMLLNNIGYSHYLAGHYDLAEKHFRMAIGIDNGYRIAISNLGLVYARRTEYRRAVETLSQVLAEHEAYNDVGYIAFRNGDFEDAMWLLSNAAEISPTYYETAYDNLEMLREAMASKERPEYSGTGSSVDGEPARPARLQEASGGMKQSASPEQQYRRTIFGPLDVYSASSYESDIVGRIEKGEKVIQFFKTNSWSFIAFGDLMSTNPSIGWVRTYYLSADRVASLD